MISFDEHGEIEMTRHRFGWGSAVAAWCLTNGEPFGEPYRRFVEENYNRVVLEYDLKWPEWLMRDRRRMLFDSMNWFRDKNIEIRGHALLWPDWQWMPDFVREFKDDPERLRRVVSEHIADRAGSLSGRLRDWDVVNEPFSNRDLMDVLGDETMVDWFRTAKESDPHAKLYINDFGILNFGGRDVHHQNHYEKTIRFLLDKGTPLEGIGIGLVATLLHTAAHDLADGHSRDRNSTHGRLEFFKLFLTEDDHDLDHLRFARFVTTLPSSLCSAFFRQPIAVSRVFLTLSIVKR